MNDGDAIVMETTMVQFTEFDSLGVGGFGCFNIPAKDFTVAKNLQSASLHTTLTTDNVCPGVGRPLAPGKDGTPIGSSFASHTSLASSMVRSCSGVPSRDAAKCRCPESRVSTHRSDCSARVAGESSSKAIVLR